MPKFEICEPDARFLQILKLIEKEDAPLLEELGEEIVEKLKEIASTKGKDPQNPTERVRVRLSNEYLASLPENKRGTADDVYRKFVRAWHGLHTRHGKRFYVDEEGNEMRTETYINAVLPKDKDGNPILVPVVLPRIVPEEFRR